MALLNRESSQDIELGQEQLNSLVEHQITPADEKKQAGDDITTSLGITVQETQTDVVLSIETSGINIKELDIKVSEEAVFIKGKRRFDARNGYRGMFCSAFHYCQFQQVIPLPALVHNGKIQSVCTNGTLWLTMPKSENAKHCIVSISLPNPSGH